MKRYTKSRVNLSTQKVTVDPCCFSIWKDLFGSHSERRINGCGWWGERGTKNDILRNQMYLNNIMH